MEDSTANQEAEGDFLEEDIDFRRMKKTHEVVLNLNTRPLLRAFFLVGLFDSTVYVFTLREVIEGPIEGFEYIYLIYIYDVVESKRRH